MAEDALRVFGELDDVRGLAHASRLLSLTHSWVSHWGEMIDCLHRALIQQEGGHDRCHRAPVDEQREHQRHGCCRVVQAVERRVRRGRERAPTGAAAIARLGAGVDAHVAPADQPLVGAGQVGALRYRRWKPALQTTPGYQPRSFHSGRLGFSAPIVLGLPWPG